MPLSDPQTACQGCGKQVRTVDLDTKSVGGTVLYFCRDCARRWQSMIAEAVPLLLSRLVRERGSHE